MRHLEAAEQELEEKVRNRTITPELATETIGRLRRIQDKVSKVLHDLEEHSPGLPNAC